MPRAAIAALLGLGFCGLAALVGPLAMAGFHRAPAWQIVALAVAALAQGVLLAAWARPGARTAAATA